MTPRLRHCNGKSSACFEAIFCSNQTFKKVASSMLELKAHEQHGVGTLGRRFRRVSISLVSKGLALPTGGLHCKLFITVLTCTITAFSVAGVCQSAMWQIYILGKVGV